MPRLGSLCKTGHNSRAPSPISRTRPTEPPSMCVFGLDVPTMGILSPLFLHMKGDRYPQAAMAWFPAIRFDLGTMAQEQQHLPTLRRPSLAPSTRGAPHRGGATTASKTTNSADCSSPISTTLQSNHPGTGSASSCHFDKVLAGFVSAPTKRPASFRHLHWCQRFRCVVVWLLRWTSTVGSLAGLN